MADTTKGYGTTLGYATTVNGPFLPIAQIRDITDGGLTIEETDTSHMSSPNQAREKEPDWINAENISFEALYTKAQYNTMLGLRGQTVWFRMVTPDSAQNTFQGFINNIGREIPLEGRISSNIDVTVTGVPIFSTTAS